MTVTAPIRRVPGIARMLERQNLWSLALCIGNAPLPTSDLALPCATYSPSPLTKHELFLAGYCLLQQAEKSSVILFCSACLERPSAISARTRTEESQGQSGLGSCLLPPRSRGKSAHLA